MSTLRIIHATLAIAISGSAGSLCLPQVGVAHAQAASMQAETTSNPKKPFPIVSVQIGDVSLSVPKEWVDSKFFQIHVSQSSGSFVRFVNAHHRASPRTPYFSVPPLSLFAIVEAPKGLVESNLKKRIKEVATRWDGRKPDEHGFWKWKANEYLDVRKTYERPFGQPLIVNCALGSKLREANNCTVDFYWTLSTSVRYRFLVSDVPESQWTYVDQQVLSLLRFLDGK